MDRVGQLVILCVDMYTSNLYQIRLMPFERSEHGYSGDRCTPIWRVYSHAAADGSCGGHTGKDMRCLWQDGERLYSEADRNDDFKGKYASTAAEENG